jgi:hypothetical protein
MRLAPVINTMLAFHHRGMRFPDINDLVRDAATILNETDPEPNSPSWQP